MKIALISHYNVKETLGGGILKATLSKAKGLTNLGHGVKVFCLGDSDIEYLHSDGYKVVEIKSMALKGFKDRNVVLDRYVNRSKKNLKNYKTALSEFDPDVIITTTEHLIGWIALNYAKSQSWQKRIYYYPHVILSKVEKFVPKENVIGRFVAKHLLVPKTIKLINQCDGVIAINQASINDLQSLGANVPMHIAPNAINYELFSSVEKVKHEGFNLMYIGLLSERKNQKFLIESLKHLPKDVKLILVGQVYDVGYYQALLKLVDKLKVNVEFVYKLSQEEIAERLKEVDVFVSASLLEVQSLAILEALSSGTPVVMLENETNVGIEDVEGLNVLPSDCSPEEFANSVQKLLSMNLQGYLKMSESLKKYSKQFSEEESARTLVEVVSHSK